MFPPIQLMKLNTAVETTPIFTHEGARATHTDAFRNLKRSVLTCLLWEDAFYESGSEISQRIAALIPTVKPEQDASPAQVAAEGAKLVRSKPDG